MRSITTLIVFVLLLVVFFSSPLAANTVIYDAVRDYSCVVPDYYYRGIHYHNDGIGTGNVSYWMTNAHPAVWRMMATPAGGGSYNPDPHDWGLWGSYITKYGFLSGHPEGWDSSQWLGIRPNSNGGPSNLIRWDSGYSGDVTIEVNAKYFPVDVYDPDGCDIILYVDGVIVEQNVVDNSTPDTTILYNTNIDFDTRVELLVDPLTFTGQDSVLVNMTVTTDGAGSYSVANLAENALNHEYEVNAHLLSNGLDLVSDCDRGNWRFYHDPALTPSIPSTFELLYGFNSGTYGTSGADGREGYCDVIADADFIEANPDYLDNGPSIEMLWDATNGTWNYNDVLIRPSNENVVCVWKGNFDRTVNINYSIIYLGTGDGIDFGIYDIKAGQWVVPMADVAALASSSVASYTVNAGESLYFVVGPGSSNDGTGDIAKLSISIDSPMAFLSIPENDLDQNYKVEAGDLNVIAQNWLDDESNPDSGVIADAKADFDMTARYQYDGGYSPGDPDGIYGSRWYIPDSSGANTGTDHAAWVATCGARSYGHGYMYAHQRGAEPSLWDMYTYYNTFNTGPHLRMGDNADYLIAEVYDSSSGTIGDRSVDYRWISGITGDITVRWKMKIHYASDYFCGSGGVVVNNKVVALGDFINGGNQEIWEGSYRFDAVPGDWVEFRVWSERDGTPQRGNTFDLSATIEYSDCNGEAAGDLTGDCIVNLYDFVVLAQSWLNCGIVPLTECANY